MAKIRVNMAKDGVVGQSDDDNEVVADIADTDDSDDDDEILMSNFYSIES